MSADNGIYILHCNDGYRVSHCQCIENIYCQCRRKDDLEFNARYLYQYFGDCEVWTKHKSAQDEATRLYQEIVGDDCGIVEYGIQSIGSGKFEFPKEEPFCCNNPLIVSIDGEEQCQNCGE